MAVLIAIVGLIGVGSVVVGVTYGLSSLPRLLSKKKSKKSCCD
jgi:hypothetical protein